MHVICIQGYLRKTVFYIKTVKSINFVDKFESYKIDNNWFIVFQIVNPTPVL